MESEDAIDLHELLRRLRRGLSQIFGLAALGIAVAGLSVIVTSAFRPAVTSTRVIFSFPGVERGLYPDSSSFQPDDLRAPVVIAEALRRQDLNTSADFQTRIRSAISISGIIPDNIAEERDRLRAAGQTPPPFIPDEYQVLLTLPRRNSLSRESRESLLREIISVYRENFQRTYVDSPLAFGSVFATLKDVDYSEYNLVFQREMENIKAYLSEFVEKVPTFRSVSTNLTFSELEERTELFEQIQLNEVLGLIQENGLSRNRRLALTKFDYYLRRLREQESRLLEEQSVINDLLSKAQSRSQNFVLGMTDQATRVTQNSPVVDQDLLELLLANDPYNFLVRQALDTGLEVKQVQSEIARISAARTRLEQFMQSDIGDQSEAIQQLEDTMKILESSYRDLIVAIQATHDDFVRQDMSESIRLSSQVGTASLLRPVVISSVVGGILAGSLGFGLSLLGVYCDRRPR